MRRAALTALLWIAVTGCASPEPSDSPPALEKQYRNGELEVSLQADRTRLTAAESLELTVNVRAPETAELDWPEEIGGSDFRAAVVGRSGPRLLDDERVETVRRFRLEPLVTGDLELPGLRITARSEAGTVTVATDSIPIAVESVFGEAPKELADIVGPVSVGPGWRAIVLAALTLAAVAAGAFVLLRPKRAPPAAATPPDPAQAALAELDGLLREGALERFEAPKFFGALSDLVRRYCEARLGLHAPRLTSQEFLAALERRPQLAAAPREALAQFLRLSDRAQFAAEQPSIEARREAVETCRRFITATAGPASPPSLQ